MGRQAHMQLCVLQVLLGLYAMHAGDVWVHGGGTAIEESVWAALAANPQTGVDGVSPGQVGPPTWGRPSSWRPHLHWPTCWFV